jgi:glutamyl-Q tRNA(Asp) synthetase
VPTGVHPYVGRFAPSPTGDLHLGSLYAAAASFLDARACGGRWLLRIEDLDRPRVVPGAAARIQATLERFGFEWDGPILRQSDRIERYAAALSRLQRAGLSFDCSCSRRDIEGATRYPGTCRAGAAQTGAATGRRLRVEPRSIAFSDRIQGEFRQDVAAASGDILMQRRDGIPAYVLAVVVDDAEQGISDIVRGADLLDDTPRQIYLQEALGLPRPRYAHVPALTEADGAKLAKSRRSVSLEAGRPETQLFLVLGLLGLRPPAGLERAGIGALWTWAFASWDAARVPRRLFLPVNADSRSRL